MKRHLRRFKGITPVNFYWFLKECEWRFNGGKQYKVMINSPTYDQQLSIMDYGKEADGLNKSLPDTWIAGSEIKPLRRGEVVHVIGRKFPPRNGDQD